MRPFFKDEDFNFLTEIALGAAYHQAADVGEVLSTVERIRNGDAQSWADEWTATADRLTAEAAANADHGRPRSAARQFRGRGLALRAGRQRHPRRAHLRLARPAGPRLTAADPSPAYLWQRGAGLGDAGPRPATGSVQKQQGS
jgi:hypothetical protein